jgi:outer membrane receptor protein involved in Fe transport
MEKLMKKLLLLSSILVAAPAYAKSEEIVVTARKQAELQIDTPVFIKYYDGKDLEKTSAIQLEDVFGFGTRSNVSAGDALLLSMRGQTQPDLSSTVDLSVGVYIDDVYAARTHGQNVPLLDIKNIQVLRGPQGTYFGRNTTGGAVLIQSNDVELGRDTMEYRVGYSRFNEIAASGVYNTSLTDNIGARIAVQRITRDSVSLDRVGAKYAEKDIWNGRAKLYHDGGWIKNTLTAEHYYNRGLSDQRFLVYAFPAAGALRTSNQINEDARVHTNVEHYSLKSEVYDNLKFVGGYRRVKSLNMTDYDGLPDIQ